MSKDQAPSPSRPLSPRAQDRLCLSGDIVLLMLTKGYQALVDLADLPLVTGVTWTASEVGQTVYADSAKGFLHRRLMNAGSGEVVDHIDGDGLNNRRENLRLCTQKENVRNARKRTGTASQYKGVSFIPRAGKWSATIKVDYKALHLGRFETEEGAARAYDAAARRYFGEFARTNFD